MYEYFIEDNQILLVTEICDGGEVFDRIEDNKGVSEKDAAIIFK
jgi:serine/threonine protein kinase